MVAPWTFFVDRSCGAHLVPEALRHAGEEVEVHDDRFAQNTADEVWVPAVSKLDRLVLTKDSAIAKNHLQRLIVASYRTRLFVFTSAGISGAKMADISAKAARAMRKLADRNDPPFIAKVYRDGKVRIWKDRRALLDELASFPVKKPQR